MQDQSNRDYSKPYNQLRPRSTASSGTELDEFCPEIEQSAIGSMGLDKAVKQHDKDFKKAQDETTFQASTTAQGSPQTGMPPMMSPAGQKLASKTAPSGALDWRKTQIGRR